MVGSGKRLLIRILGGEYNIDELGFIGVAQMR